MVKTIWQNKEEFMKTTALIMAGGKGERFWPKSRVNMPKPVSYTHLDVYKRQDYISRQRFY